MNTFLTRFALGSMVVALAALSPAAARADFGDGFGLVPDSFWAGTCDLPAVEPGDTDEAAREKRDCHATSTAAPQTAVPVTQGGAHPDGTVTFELNPVTSVPHAPGSSYPEGTLKDVVVDFPPGLIGDPEATPKCAQSDLTNDLCPIETQVGIVELRLENGTGGFNFCPSGQPLEADFPQFSQGAELRCRFPVYNVAAGDGQTALLGFQYWPGISILMVPEVRTDGDYGLRVKVSDAAEAPAVSLSTVTLWGVPGDPKHDAFRFRGGNTERIPPGQEWPADEPIRPFLTNPTACDGSQPLTSIEVASWQDPGVFVRDEHESPPVTGCDQVPFDPTAGIQPTAATANSASGLSVDIGTPQSSDPDVLGTAHLKKAVVTLPAGVSINPSAATGLQGCSDAQIALGTNQVPTCPDGSKIGTAAIFTPVLPAPDGPGTPNVTGDVYLGQPKSTNPLSGEMFRLLIVLRNAERNLLIKLPGSVIADPRTGQLTTTFDNNPQVPFETLNVTFKGGPRGLLAMPQRCGSYAWAAELTPWTAHAGGGGAADTVTGSFAIAGDCSHGFSPDLLAGMDNRQAGGSGTFSFTFSRTDAEQWFGGLTAELPTGLLASVRGVPLCTDAQAKAGACPAGSRIGSVDAAAGAGNPFVLERKGNVYLTEGYKGGAYGLAVEVPVEAGPFRGPLALSTIWVRQAIHVDPVDAHVTVISDPLPTIHHGIPLLIRRITVAVDRPGFMVNPTSCADKQVTATLLSTEGAAAAVASPFEVDGCTALPFRPKLTMRLTGRKQVKDGKHPGIRAVVTQQPGEANLKKATVRLPRSLALDPENAQSLCEFEDGLRVDCPKSSIIGRARAFTPLLNRPLTGPVYFVKNVRIHPRSGRPIRTLPTLLIPLRGEIALDLRATTDVQRRTNKLVNTFPTIPDAPITRFELNLEGGKGGIIVVTHNKNICRRRQVTQVDLDGQNGRRHDSRVRMRRPCGKRARLKISRARWQGKRVKVSGRIRRAAKRALKVNVRCGGKKVGERVKPKRGRWKAGLKLRGRCADVRRARVTVRYVGGPKVRLAREKRTVRRR